MSPLRGWVRYSGLVILTFWLLGGAVWAADVQGHWEGKIKLPGTELSFDVDLSKDGENWKGDISIPLQGAKDLPLSGIALQGDRLSFAISGIPGSPSFSGTLASAGDRVEGEFTQGGQGFPFEMEKAESFTSRAKSSLEGFDAFVEQALTDWKGVGLSVGIVAEDEVIWLKGFGERDREKKLPVTPDTLFAIGSSSKAFTTFALGLLVDQGKLDWDKPLVNYLPGFQLYDESATLRFTPRDLVTHRSGLPRHDLVWYNNNELTRADVFHRLRYLQPNKDLREIFQYNNLMYLTAGYLLEQLTGVPWETSITQMVLTPLGMKNTNFSVHDSQKAADFSQPYEVRDEEIRKRAFRDIGMIGPAGSINSSAADMVQWLRVQLGGGKIGDRRIISESLLRDMHTPHMAIPQYPIEPRVSPTAYGLGWMVNSYQGHFRVGHGGNIDGFSALVTLFPNDRLGLVVLSNQNGSSLPGLITAHAADRILGLPAKDWNQEALEKAKVARQSQKEAEAKKETVRIQGTQPSRPLSEFAGRYRHPGYGILTIEGSEDGLSMEFNKIRAPLQHWHYDMFNGGENPEDRTFEDMKIQFAANLKGDIESVLAPFEPNVDPIRFTRMPDAQLEDPAYLARFEGTYELSGQKAQVQLQGSVLTFGVAGQSPRRLQPYRNDEFNLEGLTGFSIQFVTVEGKVTEAVLKQPNGVFTAPRVEQ